MADDARIVLADLDNLLRPFVVPDDLALLLSTNDTTSLPLAENERKSSRQKP
jgi:hypothetical protein